MGSKRLGRRYAGLGGAFLSFAFGAGAHASCGLEADVLCQAEFKTVNACGRNVQIRTFCTNKPVPKITPEMREEAKKYPELEDDYERTNACLSDLGDCKATDKKDGGKEVADEVTRYNGLLEEDELEPLRESITSEEKSTSRDAATLVMKRGFLRATVDYHMIYRVFHDKEFHASAEGVDLVSKKIVDDELAEQTKLAGILKEMRLKFTANGDKKSQRATSTYEGIAMGQVAMLEAVSCELGRLAGINRDRQNKMRSIVGDKLLETPAFSITSQLGNGSSQEPSDITGTGRQPAAIPGKQDTDQLAKTEDSPLTGPKRDVTGTKRESTVTEAEQPAKVQAEPGNTQIAADWMDGLNLSGLLGPPAAIARIRAGSPTARAEEEEALDETLFARVRKKYRQKDEQGLFPQERGVRRELLGRAAR